MGVLPSKFFPIAPFYESQRQQKFAFPDIPEKEVFYYFTPFHVTFLVIHRVKEF